MNDPHVQCLVYRIEHHSSIDFREDKSFCRDEQAFRLKVENGMARFEMHKHFPTIEEAHESLANYRRVWEFDAQLRYGPDSFKLVLDYEKSKIIDRSPRPGVASPVPIRISIGLPKLSLRISVGYPEPPGDIFLNPDAETIHHRYMGYRKGREPLGSMANFCLTVLEESTGKSKKKRKAAELKYGIESKVLSKLGELTNNKGGAEARKAEGMAQDFSNEERMFLEKVVKVIIRRMVENNPSEGNLPMIVMSDLPSL